MTIEERIKYAEKRKEAAFSTCALSDLVYWTGYLDAVKAVKEDFLSQIGKMEDQSDEQR